MYSTNDWRDYLQHNWGTSAKMKEAEKKYNAEYYQKHRDEILKSRKKENASREELDDQSDYKFRGRKITSEDDLHKRASEEEDEVARLIEENDKVDGFSDEVKANVKKHNEQVKKNIEELTATVNDYINAHPEMSDEQRQNLADSLTKQLDRAHTQMIDLKSKSGKDYVNGLTKDTKSSKSKSKSTKKSKSSRSSKKKNSSTTVTQNTNTNSSKDTEEKTSVIDDMRKKYGR